VGQLRSSNTSHLGEIGVSQGLVFGHLDGKNKDAEKDAMNILLDQSRETVLGLQSLQ